MFSFPFDFRSFIVEEESGKSPPSCCFTIHRPLSLPFPINPLLIDRHLSFTSFLTFKVVRRRRYRCRFFVLFAVVLLLFSVVPLILNALALAPLANFLGLKLISQVDLVACFSSPLLWAMISPPAPLPFPSQTNHYKQLHDRTQNPFVSIDSRHLLFF